MFEGPLSTAAYTSFCGVPGVPGVPAQISALLSGTRAENLGVPGVPGDASEHLGTPSEHVDEAAKRLNFLREHLGTPGTPVFEGDCQDV